MLGAVLVFGVAVYFGFVRGQAYFLAEEERKAKLKWYEEAEEIDVYDEKINKGGK